MGHSNNRDTLGDRVKRYEAVSKPLLSRRTPVIVRIDGKAFHTFTRGCEKPFDKQLVKAMAYATAKTAQNMQGFKLAYVQSDEATFLLSDYDTLETGAWFDNEVNKIVSITASMFTAYFNEWLNQNHNSTKTLQGLAFFDARAFNVPHDDYPNVFIWRQRDWERNSIQMLARSLYSQNQLNGKNVTELQEMIKAKGKDWESLDLPYKWGTFIKTDGHAYFGKADYDKILEMVSYYPEGRNDG